MNPEDYHLEFYAQGDRLPMKDWLEDLAATEPAKYNALMYALTEILARQGAGVCGTELGKNLGQGLYEFRLRHTRDELQAKTQPHLPATGASEPAKVLLRVFFAVYGDRVVLLLGGYDKGRDPSARRQGKEVAEARKRLKDHHAQLVAAAKAATGPSGAEDSSVDPVLEAERRVPASRSFLMWFRILRQRKKRDQETKPQAKR